MPLKKNENQILINSLNSHKPHPRSWLQQQAQLHPTRPAFYFENKSWSFAALNQSVQRYATYFAEKIPENVKRVALYSQNSVQCYLTILALWELGLEVQFLNVHLTSEEITFQLADAKTSWLIAEHVPISVTGFLLEFPSPGQLPAVDEIDYHDSGYDEEKIASIMYTSGTTGKPKGVPQTFANHRASALATKMNMKLTESDSWICCLPLYHISGLAILLRSLVLGISVRLHTNFSPKRIHEELLEGRKICLSVVTIMLKDLLPLVPEKGYLTAPKLLLGGGPIDRDTLSQCVAKKLLVIQSYGMTETCSQVIALSPEKASEKLGSAGVPLMGTKLKIEMKYDQQPTGEILLKGPTIASHYLNYREEVSWTKDGWFRTGDLGHLDEEGFLYVDSRMSELIISGGENIYPTEIEAALLQSEWIQEAVVVGRKDDRWGQRPVAYLVVKEEVTLTTEELTSLLQPLARFKHPSEIFSVSRIPKTASGKPLKRLFLTEERVNYIENQLK
ncbi:o-succinylbenzoate--CoA ligase [Enterococcus sp. DIV0660C]|uniref:o-succinylbenzoate--CoA ligase n=1 Tax=Enterococcus sp. DIV0660C TaxID=2230880 RepID=UPI001A8E3D4C|nr:o-succinylbenzoate--CoA ligase [Enterococcus sp. DIV0660C]MBO0431225.1 o-succinylbenzoate--CoA ligase [Enterococcus sp. DIV0660C]